VAGHDERKKKKRLKVNDESVRGHTAQQQQQRKSGKKNI
jgi:hypothetical protein